MYIYTLCGYKRKCRVTFLSPQLQNSEYGYIILIVIVDCIHNYRQTQISGFRFCGNRIFSLMRDLNHEIRLAGGKPGSQFAGGQHGAAPTRPPRVRGHKPPLRRICIDIMTRPIS